MLYHVVISGGFGSLCGKYLEMKDWKKIPDRARGPDFVGGMEEKGEVEQGFEVQEVQDAKEFLSSESDHSSEFVEPLFGELALLDHDGLHEYSGSPRILAAEVPKLSKKEALLLREVKYEKEQLGCHDALLKSVKPGTTHKVNGKRKKLLIYAWILVERNVSSIDGAFMHNVASILLMKHSSVRTFLVRHDRTCGHKCRDCVRYI